MCDFDCEGPSVWSERWHAAAKPYVCAACREPIQPGHRYHYSFGIWDGESAVYRHCQRCWAMISALMPRLDHPVDLYLDCGMSWEDAFYGAPPDEVAELAFLLPGEKPGDLLALETTT